MLKGHLLARVQQSLKIKPGSEGLNLQKGQSQPLYFKGDRMYSHKIAQFNYTTYDVRREQDIVNPGTPRCNIMLLSGQHAIEPMQEGSSSASQDPQPHSYVYARVIGIYHANVVYTGPGMIDYTPNRMDFLWVRWYDHQEGENATQLDQLSFPPITSEGAFGFVDPANVVRGCHIIPRFSKGKRYPDGIGYSRLAHDSHEWLSYYIGR